MEPDFYLLLAPPFEFLTSSNSNGSHLRWETKRRRGMCIVHCSREILGVGSFRAQGRYRRSKVINLCS